MDEYKIKQIEEGLTKIEFPEFDKVSSDAPVFYNPHKKKEKLTFVIYLVEAELEEFVTKMK